MNLVRLPIMLNKGDTDDLDSFHYQLLTLNILNLCQQYCYHRDHCQPESLLDVLHVHLNTVLEHLWDDSSFQEKGQEAQ